jgi:hypothetical protein
MIPLVTEMSVDKKIDAVCQSLSAIMNSIMPPDWLSRFFLSTAMEARSLMI